jgi:hypothetical protein
MDNKDLVAQKQAFNFLSDIYEVMKCFDKNPAKLNAKITDLRNKFDKTRSLLNTMPGIDMSLTEQEQYYESLLKQYLLKNELLNSYKQSCSNFDMPKLEYDPNEVAQSIHQSIEATPNDYTSESLAGDVLMQQQHSINEDAQSDYLGSDMIGIEFDTNENIQ